ncbi:DUF1684 domain-containing protein [Cytophagaceae bacterium DM2B3-1]|uniref:DUF1684 domain-containing protein n=1 Tax=Xanthocytophaga flava TaxID=3048013 RepID=A0ABT7CHG7_9BACT|nr:DUF1684 domain-containing protein [Xanthocytophaga flavus]MDJ1492425.1 DUF1684 domain-containing protein [Xanthocytophaga flavus]
MKSVFWKIVRPKTRISVKPDGKDSPIPKKERSDFTGLVYFPVDSMYRVQAKLVKDTLQKTFEMKTSTTRSPLYRVYGKPGVW